MGNATIDSNGLNIQTLPEVIDDLTLGFKSIYGEAINIDQNTPDGQLIGIIAKLDLDLQENLMAIWNSFNPDTAQGEALHKIIKLAGLTRNPATQSSAVLTITISKPLTLSSSFTVSDTIGQEWVITAETVLATAGAHSITVKAKEWGAINALANTITEAVTIIDGVVSFTNSANAIAGINEEDDIALRIRRNKSVEKPSFSTIGGLIARLLDIDGVIDAMVYENKTATYDAVKAMDGHTIWAIVDGGVNSIISEAIAKEKTAGVGMKGIVTGTFTETFTRADLSTFTYIHTVYFDRPTIINPFIRVTATATSGTVDDVLIKMKIAERMYRINEDINATALYSNIYQAGTNFIATALELSYDGISWVSTNLSAGFDDKFVITTANITVTVL